MPSGDDFQSGGGVVREGFMEEVITGAGPELRSLTQSPWTECLRGVGGASPEAFSRPAARPWAGAWVGASGSREMQPSLTAKCSLTPRQNPERPNRGRMGGWAPGGAPWRGQVSDGVRALGSNHTSASFS